MDLEKLRNDYYKIEAKVLVALCEAIEESPIESDYYSGKCIKVNHVDYVELCRATDSFLFFIDENGYHHNIRRVNLERLLDILESLETEEYKAIINKHKVENYIDKLD